MFLAFHIFTNADKVHSARVLKRLGLEDCFDGIIGDLCDASVDGSKLHVTPVVCKPFKQAFEEVFKIAKINPRKTVKFYSCYSSTKFGRSLFNSTSSTNTPSLGPLQLFFDDSFRN
ncbi:hypothetical protein SAY87_017881 [Trapa incisa]|uniref:Uncharacterized protein n=1 Tax=Trapa incisa TaxID=236973 RepID=A0AAN7QS98_9MYRT|nr:hypothetical protein SAY87_017881 [Trapa incisa]